MPTIFFDYYKIFICKSMNYTTLNIDLDAMFKICILYTINDCVKSKDLREKLEKIKFKIKKKLFYHFFGEVFAHVRKISQSMLSRFSSLLLLIFISNILFAQRLINDKVDVQAGSGVNYREAVLYFPANYSADKTYPLVIFTHGMGEAGNNINLLYRTGLPKVLKSGYRPFFDFIMVAPQHRSFSASTDWIPGILEDAKRRWKIDTNRIYLTGLSAGGRSVYGSQLSLSPATASKFAAIVLNAAVVPASSVTNYEYWSVSKTPLWTVVGEYDRSYVTKNAKVVNEVNKLVPGLAKLTIQPGIGHFGWDNVYRGRVKHGNKNMWEWMYQFTRSSPNFPQIGNEEPVEDIAGTKPIRVNFFGGTNPYNNPNWNNWNLGSGLKKDVVSPLLTYADGSESGVKANLSESMGIIDNTSYYGSGMAPAPVLRYGSYSTKKRIMTLTGLTPGKKYNLEFYASRSRNNHATVFSIKKTTRQVSTYYNFNNKASFTDVKANSQGKIVITIKNAQTYQYFNGFTIAESNNTSGNDDDDDNDDDSEEDDDTDD